MAEDEGSLGWGAEAVEFMADIIPEVRVSYA